MHRAGGSSKSIPVDIRIISATNRDLPEMVARGLFREDLCYRLKVIQINLPALLERKTGLPLLRDNFISSLHRYYNKKIIGISEDAERIMMDYAWPGNVRELRNALEHAFVIANGSLIGLNNLPSELRNAAPDGAPHELAGTDLNAEEEMIRRALLPARGNRAESGDMLDMHRTTPWRKMKEYGIGKDSGKKSSSR